LKPPHVALAVFCGEARQNPDGTLTVDRVLDRLTVTAAAGPLPTIAQLVAVIALRCDTIGGAHELALDVNSPDAGPRRLAVLPVDLSAEGDSIARILRMPLEIDRLGVYWFDVRWDERVVTRMR
jgi:hypothetical protein